MNSTELLALFLINMFSRAELKSLEVISICHPNYWTLAQREVLFQAMKLANLPFLGLIDDTSAIIQLYAVQHSRKFIYESHSVLFVDFGASSFRAYRVVFTSNGTDPLGRQTSYEFSERVSGIGLIRRIAEHEGCSFSQAQKRLIANPNPYADLLVLDMEVVYDLVQSAVNGEIDEVQLIGGASRFPFVIETIKEVVGYTDILTELPQMDSMALGALHVMQAALNESRFKLVPVVKPPIYTSVLRCGSEVSQYCKRRGKCQDYVVVKNRVCEEVVILAKAEEVPEAMDPKLAVFKMKNSSNLPHDQTLSGIFTMIQPAPVIDSAMWCSSGARQCHPVVVEQSSLTDPNARLKEQFVKTITKGFKDRLERREVLAQLSDLVRAFDVFLSSKSVAGDVHDPNLMKARELVDGHVEISTSEMRQLLKNLEQKARMLNMAL